MFKGRVRYFINSIFDILLKCKKTERDDFSIVLIKIDGIGDFIIWLDSIRQLERSFGNEKVLLVCTQKVFDLADKISFFNKIITVDIDKYRSRFFYRFSFLKKLNCFLFEKAISTIYSRDFVVDDLIHNMNAKIKIGYDGNYEYLREWQRKIVNKWYTQLVPKSGELLKSELELNAHFISILCDVPFNPQLPLYKGDLSLDSDFPQNYCVFFLSAGDGYRAWSVTNYVAVANKMRYNGTIVLLGYGRDDELRAIHFIGKLKKRNYINLVNNSSLLESLAIVSHADFVVGNDSAGIHMAVAVHTPSVCIAPGAHYGRFVPYPSFLPDKKFHPKTIFYQMDCFGCNYNCIRPIVEQYECIKKIERERVLEIIDNI